MRQDVQKQLYETLITGLTDARAKLTEAETELTQMLIGCICAHHVAKKVAFLQTLAEKLYALQELERQVAKISK